MGIELRRMTLLPVGRPIAMLYAVMALLILPCMLIMLAAGPPDADQEMPMPVMFVVIALYPLIGFIGGMTLVFLYNNVAARITSGLHLEIFEITAARQRVSPPDAGQEPAV